MRESSLGRSRTVWAIVGLLGLCVALVAFAAVVWWLPGPRASVPSASGLNPSGPVLAIASPTRTPVGLPDPKRTPGSINPNVTPDNLRTTICLGGWTTTIRPPSAYTSALKLIQIVEYGYSDRSPSHYQEDHLVPLELGGAPRDPANLWPEPNVILLSDGTQVGSGAKDHLEDFLHHAVCTGSMSLGDAQRLIAGDWIVAWEAAGQP